jgi:four helix bundle protein
LESFPSGYLGGVIGRRLLKSETSIRENYREADREHSKADFVRKMTLAKKEAAEAAYWLEICIEAGPMTSAEIQRLAQEGATAARTGKHAAWLEAFLVRHPTQPARAVPQPREHRAASPIHHSKSVFARKNAAQQLRALDHLPLKYETQYPTHF